MPGFNVWLLLPETVTAGADAGITGLHVVDQKAKVEGGKITEYRITMEVTFVLE